MFCYVLPLIFKINSVSAYYYIVYSEIMNLL